MNTTPRRTGPWYLLALAVLLADQTVKSYIDAVKPLGWWHEVTSFFNLVHVLNPGAAFSFLAGAGGWQRWLFLGIAIAASTCLVWMLRQSRPRGESLGLSLILGGALGNAADRAWRGHVIDFLDFHVAGWHWPAFNLADVGISIGAACVVLSSFNSPTRTQPQR